jgi:AbrB family looped-hinge helix DNA binding protein
MPKCHVKLGRRGRLVIPAEFRKALGLSVGDEITIELRDGELRLRSFGATLERVQAVVRKYVPDDRSLADELIAERRQEAAREDQE